MRFKGVDDVQKLERQMENRICEKVGCTTTFLAELWGVLQDLRIARDQGMQNILLQVDSESVVKKH